MRQNLLRRLRSLFSRRRAQQPLRPRRPGLETLEDRTALTSTLYVDFGDRFPSGTLSGSGVTIGALKSTLSGANPNIDGPQLFDNFGFPYSDTTRFKMTSFDRTYPASPAARRAEIMAFVTRFYEPLDIEVVELTATPKTTKTGLSVRAAASLAEMSATMGANESAAKNNDTYVLVGKIAIGTTNDNPAVFTFSAYGGISTGTDIGKANNTDGTALVLLAGISGFYEGSAFLGSQVAHEAAHAFGLAHTFGNFPSVAPAGSAINNALPESDLMSYRAYTSHGGYNFFSRYPMVAGDGNLSNSTLAAAVGPGVAPAAQPTPFDQMLNDASIGGNPAIEYVTGTGANDVVTITRASATTATVTVEAFVSADFTSPIPVPKLGGNAYSYTINLSPTKALRLDGGAGNDRFVIDASLGGIVNIFGMSETDEVVVDGGGGTASAVYVPGTNAVVGLDANPDLRGQLMVTTAAATTTTINFQEFESIGSVKLSNVAKLTYQTPAGADNLFLNTITGQTALGGTVGSGVTTVPFLFSNVTELVLDLGLADTTAGAAADDFVTLQAALTSAGLSRVTINAGDGNNAFNVAAASLALPVAGGGFTYNVGAGNDTLAFKVPGVALPTGFTFTGGDGDDTLDLSAGGLALAAGSAFRFEGDAGSDRIAFSPTGLSLAAGSTFRFNGGDGDDRCDVPTDGAAFPAGAFTFDGGAGSDTVSGSGALGRTWLLTSGNGGTLNGRVSFLGAENVLGDGANDQFIVRPGIRFAGVLDGAGGLDSLNMAGLARVVVTLVLGGTDGFNAVLAGPASLSVRNVNTLIASGAVGDTLQGLGSSAGWTLSGAGNSYTAPGGGSVNFSGFDVLRGGAGSDALTVSLASGLPIPVTGVVFDAGGGFDTFRADGSAGADLFVLGGSFVTMNSRRLTYVGMDKLDLRGAGGNDLFTSAAVAMAVREVELRGDNGNDTFVLNASVTTRFTVLGDAPVSRASGGDVLKLNRGGAALVSPRPNRSVNTARLIIAGRQALTFRGIERFTDAGAQFLPV